MLFLENFIKTNNFGKSKNVIESICTEVNQEPPNSHEAALSFAMKFSHVVEFDLVSQGGKTGVIVRKDPSCITIGDVSGRKITYFKHAILSYSIIPDHPEYENYRKHNKARSGNKANHEMFLAMAIKTRKYINIKMMDGTKHAGLINQFDKFSITIEKEDLYKKTIFKHFIHSFEIENRDHKHKAIDRTDL